MDGYQWSLPFSVGNEGVMRINLKKDVGDNQKQLRVLVRSGAKRSRFEVVFCPNSLSSPYRSLFSLISPLGTICKNSFMIFCEHVDLSFSSVV